MKFVLIQALYCVTGIGFFIIDLTQNKIPMGDAMIRAFIWPYAQWPFISGKVIGAWESVAGSIGL